MSKSSGASSAHEKSKKNRRGSVLFTILFFPVALFYQEIMFHLATVRTLSFETMLATAVFSAAGGLILYLLGRLTPSVSFNRMLTRVLLFVVSALFGVEYFVYRQFKIFYDLKTVTAGAGDAMTGFYQDILRMIFSPKGIVTLVLLFLPPIFHIFTARKLFRHTRLRVPLFLLTLLWTLIAFLFGDYYISQNTRLRSAYTTAYNFQDAVSDFGLMTGIRREIGNLLTGKGKSVSFRDVVVSDGGTSESTSAAGEQSDRSAAAASEAAGDGSTRKAETGPNEMDIDFAALSEMTDDEETRNLDAYCASLTPSDKNAYTGIFRGKNLIFLSAEAFSGDIIDPELTPTLYRLSTKGVQFTDFYQPASAGTTGGETENLLGIMPMDGGSSMKETATYNNYFTIGNQLNLLGYNGWAFHANDYTYYDRNLTHNNLGYSNGFMGYGNGMEQYVTDQWPQSDLEMIDGTFPLYADKTPFNIYYMTVSGHSGYTQAGNAMTAKNWDRVKNLPYSDEVKGYIAANLELEDALTSLVRQLEAKGLADDTVIVLCADHFPYGLDDDAALGEMPYLSELYGYDVTDRLQRDHNRLIIWSGSLEKRDPIVVDDPVSSIDILPTLSNLFGTEWDSRLLPGRDVFSDTDPLVFTTSYDWKTDKGTYLNTTGEFTQTDPSETLPDNYVETISTEVRNKLNFCQGVLDTNYYAHVFGDDPSATHALAVTGSVSSQKASTGAAADQTASGGTAASAGVAAGTAGGTGGTAGSSPSGAATAERGGHA